VDGDPLFRQATLPTGWAREGSEHSMGSYIVDELGRRRCSIFFKNAFYDRSANLSVVTVYGYLTTCLYDGTAPVLDEVWATREAVLTELARLRAYDVEQVEFWTKHGNSKYVADHTQGIRDCDALKARIEGDRSHV
jgi:hypothetical protein